MAKHMYPVTIPRGRSHPSTWLARRRAYPLRKYASRRPYKRRIPRNRLASANRTITTIHRIEQYNGGTGQYEVDLVSGLADVHRYIAPMVSRFPGTGPYKALYRQFRVIKVILEFFPVNQQGRYNEGTEEDFCQLYTPSLYTSINRTSAGYADDITKMASTNSMRSVVAGRYHKRVFTPCTLELTYNTAPNPSSYNPEYKQWISTEQTSTPHFGCDVLLSSTSSPRCSFKYRMRTTIVVQWKNRQPNTDLS